MAASERGFDVGVDQGIEVTLPSGAAFYVLTQDEADYLSERVTRYLADNAFINVSDFQDIDKMVVFEMFVHRWSLWVSKGRDYYDEEVNTKQLAELVNAYSTELRQLKRNLGMDKPARDRSRGDGSVASYLDALPQRALQFGYMRNEQFAHIQETFNRLAGMLQFFDNCTPEERAEFACTADDMFEVLRQEIEAYNQIDEEFRTNVQTMWIRSQ